MVPLNISDNPNDDEETLSFLPHEHPIQITISKSPESKNTKNGRKSNLNNNNERKQKKKKKKYRPSSGFCLPWMIETILFMILIASVVVLKALYRTKVNGYNLDETDVKYHNWGNLHIDDITNWCLHDDVTDCQCSNPLIPKARFGHETWSLAYHKNVHQAKTINRQLSSNKNLDVVFLGDSILEGFKGMKFGKEVVHKKDNKIVWEKLFNTATGAEFDGLILAIAGDKVSE
jgi:hypothetical protein